MTGFWRPSRWPFAVQVPVLVAVLMTGVAAAASKVVLTRLAESQESHVSQLTGAYLDGLSTALMPHVIRRDAWEAFDVLDRSRSRYSGVDARKVLVIVADETILAALDPRAYPLGQPAPDKARPDAAGFDLSAPDGRLWIHRSLAEGGVRLGRIAAEIDISAIQAVRSQTLWTLIAVNSALTVLFALLGWLTVMRTLRPLTRLSHALAAAKDGRFEPIPAAHLPPADTEAGRAYRHYNAAAGAIADREALAARLAEEERRALMGRYASALAHEVNNPLGGLFNAVRMIQRHGDDPVHRERAATLIERGLTGIRNVVRTALIVWRGETDDRPVASADVDDLRFLVESEAARRELVLDWSNGLDRPLTLPAQAFRQIALNLLINACAASAPGGRVAFRVMAGEAELILSVADEGPGLPVEARRVLQGAPLAADLSAPGLGLWTVGRLVQGLGGTIAVGPGPGTVITVHLPETVRRDAAALAA